VVSCACLCTLQILVPSQSMNRRLPHTFCRFAFSVQSLRRGSEAYSSPSPFLEPSCHAEYQTLHGSKLWAQFLLPSLTLSSLPSTAPSTMSIVLPTTEQSLEPSCELSGLQVQCRAVIAVPHADLLPFWFWVPNPARIRPILFLV